MEKINYFHAGHLMSEVFEKTGIDFTYEEEDRKKFYNLTKEEARRLRFIMAVRPHILKDYIYKNIINKPF